MNFTKLQGLGNDFLLFDARKLQTCDWPALAQAMCPRRFGVGSDGLLLLLDSKTADFRMRMFNPDGSEAEACGNGLRCLVRYIVDQGLNAKSSLSIETMAGIRQARLVMEDGETALIQVSMGKPVFESGEVPVLPEANKGISFGPMLGDYPLTIDGRTVVLNFVSMGNPHAVYFVSGSVKEFPLEAVGPLVEKNSIFPRGVNFEIVKMTGHSACDMRVWERGAGETLACGSGACAVAVASKLRDLSGDNITIRLPGGNASVSWDGRGEVWLTGPAVVVFTGQWQE
jgi:diaminopimelate epimerase